MNIDLAALPAAAETLQHMVRAPASERASFAEAQAEIERLRLIIRKLQRSQFGRRAEQLDNDQLARAESRIEAKTPSPQTRTEQASLPPHLERADVRLDLDHQTCSCCGGRLHLIGETVIEMLDHVPARLRVIRMVCANAARRIAGGCAAASDYCNQAMHSSIAGLIMSDCMMFSLTCSTR